MNQTEFDYIWENIIKRKAYSLTTEYGTDSLVFHDEVASEIYTYTEELCDYATSHYMISHEDSSATILNRYKISAAVIIAILKAKPLKKVNVRFYKESPDRWIFNEVLALFTGLSILRSYILDDVHNEGLSISTKDHNLIVDLFEKRIPLPQKERNRWERELYFLRHEGCYNLLALAHELEDFVTIAKYKEILRRKQTIIEKQAVDIKRFRKGRCFFSR